MLVQQTLKLNVIAHLNTIMQYIYILGCRRWVSILSEKKSKCYNLQTFSNTRIKTVIKKVPVMCFNLVKIGSVEFV